MSADSFLEFLINALFLIVFVIVGVEAIRHRRRVTVDTALFFGALALIIAESWALRALDIVPGRYLNAVAGALLMALPYLFLRLVNDFAIIPARIMRLAEIGLALSVLTLLAVAPPFPLGLVLPLVGYFVAVVLYAAFVTARAARRSGGVTRRRMQAVALGSVLLGLVILIVGLEAAIPRIGDFTPLIQRPLTLAAGIAYYLGFATPSVLRSAWQEPELRAFLGRAARLPRLPDTRSIVRELERGAATSLGVSQSYIALWDETDQVLRFPSVMQEEATLRPGQMIVGRAFAEQRAIFSRDSTRDDPEHADVYRAYEAIASMAAPITAGERRLGALLVYAPRAPIFADDDLALVQLLADQAAVILESRALIDEAARVRAREEATRLRDDFLSAAAHDLKTPLAALVMQAQLLERRATLRPEAPADLAGIKQVIKQTQRLRAFVVDLLDAARVENQGMVTTTEPIDLVSVATDVCKRVDSIRHTVTVESQEPIFGEFDRARLTQLLENLVGNAVKYSPDGGEIHVKLWQEDGIANLTVSDQGIGIPLADLPHIFDRFHRAANVDDRRFFGMGLGLYICRRIVEQHSGEISVTSEPGKGSTFHVSLPISHAALVEAS